MRGRPLILCGGYSGGGCGDEVPAGDAHVILDQPVRTATDAANLGPTEHALFCPGCCPADHTTTHGLVYAGLRAAT